MNRMEPVCYLYSQAVRKNNSLRCERASGAEAANTCLLLGNVFQLTCLHFSLLTARRQKPKITACPPFPQESLATWDGAWVVFFYSSINQHGLNTPLTMKSKRFWPQPRGFLPTSYCSFLPLTSSRPLHHLGSFSVSQSVQTASPAVCQLRWLAPHVFIMPLRFSCECNKHEGIDGSNLRRNPRPWKLGGTRRVYEAEYIKN